MVWVCAWALVIASPEPPQRGPCAGGVALGEALGGVAERGRGSAIGTGRGRLHLGQLLRQRLALLRGHALELVGELLEILLRLLRVAVAVGGLVAGRRPRQRAGQRGHRRGPLLGRRIDPGADLALDGAQLAQVGGEVAGSLAQLAGELAQLLGQLASRILGLVALRLEVAGQFLEPLGLAVGCLADVALLGDDGILRVRERQDRHEQEDGGDRRDGGGARPAGPEEGRDRPERGERIASLAADEPIGLGQRRSMRSGLVIERRPSSAGGTRRRREGDGELEGARDPVAQAALDVDRQRGLAERRPGPDDRRPAVRAPRGPGWPRR